MVLEFQLTSTDMALYGWIVALTSFCWIHLFHKTKNKFLVILFPILLFYLNTHLPEYYTYSGNDYLVANTLFILFYYFINVKNKSINALIHVLLGVGLPFGMSYFILKINFYIGLLFSWKPLPIDHPIARQYYAEIISRIVVLFFIFLRKLHYKIKKKEVILQKENFLLFTFFFSFIIIAIAILLFENVLSPWRDLCIFSFGLLLFFAYDYSKKLEEIKMKKKQLFDIQLELNKNNTLYHNYLFEIEKLNSLKHKILSLLRNHQSFSNETEILTQIDSLITPIIQYYSNNKVLNRILVEKNLTFQRLKINTSFHLIDDLLFLTDNEIVFLFSLILEKLTKLNELDYLSLNVKRKTDEIYMISYTIETNKKIDFLDLWKSPLYKELEEKYQMTYSHIIENNNTYLNLYIIHPERSDA